MHCPKCPSSQIAKYGRTHYGKQRFRCHGCKRQFVEHPSRQPIDQETRSLIEKLLKERLALAVIGRATMRISTPPRILCLTRWLIPRRSAKI